MYKRYQVFVSSTFTDLQDERREIIQALLELRCFPAGMELFPAANQTPWSLIQHVIDDSDYYVLIIGGRYGSVDPVTELSFTEKEFNYASERAKPILAFLHANPALIPSGKTEMTEAGKNKLDAFRRRVEAEFLVKYFENASDLGAKLSRAIAMIREDQPQTGWVRGDKALDVDQIKEVLDLQKKVRELESEVSGYRGEDVKVRLSQVSKLGVWILERAVHPQISGVQMPSNGSYLRFFYLSGKNPGVNAGGSREQANLRASIKQLMEKGFLEEGGNAYRPTADAFRLELTPIEVPAEPAITSLPHL